MDNADLCEMYPLSEHQITEGTRAFFESLDGFPDHTPQWTREIDVSEIVQAIYRAMCRAAS